MTLLETTQIPELVSGAVSKAPIVRSLSMDGRLDIEHALVEDDPRMWSRTRKYVIVGLVSSASMIAGLGANIYSPSIAQVQLELHASSQQISLSLSLFIIIQGIFPLIWSSISEIKGRKWVYTISIALATVGCVVTAMAKSIGVLLGMRCIQAAGSSSVMALGAATLADIFEPAERGSVMGIYYVAPMLGPSVGSILGGVLAQAWSWRATFWFLAIWTGLCFVCFLFFKDTFRKERSLTYQAVLRRIKADQAIATLRESSSQDVAVQSEEPKNTVTGGKTTSTTENSTTIPEDKDLEAQGPPTPPMKAVKLSLTNLNPITPITLVIRRRNNFAVLVPSGLLFAFTYCISYTCSRTLSAKYGYDALKIGLVFLSFGIGSIFGSVLGGRYSDYVLEQLKRRNSGQGYPEMRLQSTKLAMLCLPPAILAYGWFCEKKIQIAAVCVALFAAGFFSVVIYSSTLVYIVDANVGRSSAAVATNSAFRGSFAFIAAEIAVPIQDAIGDGGMYTLWAAVMIMGELLILLVVWKGGKWREEVERSEKT